MFYVWLLMLAQAFGGLAVGIVWRWHVAILLLLSAAGGFGMLVSTGLLSGFSFGELAKRPDSMVAWMIYLPTYFLFWGMPVMAGCAAGWALRLIVRTTLHRCVVLAVSLVLVAICIYITT